MLDSIRQFFKPLFESDRNEFVRRFLYTIITSIIVVILIELGLHIFEGGDWFGKATKVLVVLLILQILFLALLRSNQTSLVSWLLVISGWVGITYQAWRADGIRDAAVYVYVLVILMAALVASWRVSLTVSALSIAAMWVMALAEARGLRATNIDTPIHVARDLTAVFILLIVLVFLLVNTLRQTIQKMNADFTALVQAQQALLQSEDRFRKVFHNSPVAIVITSFDDGRIIDANDAFWNLSAHDPKNSVGKSAFELRQGLQPETRKAFIQDLLEKKSLRNNSYDFINERGEHLKTIAFYELFDVDGKSAILSMFYDVTEQNQARDALHQSEARLRAMLEAVPDMIFELKGDGTIVQFIPSAIEDLGINPGEFVGKNIAEILPQVAEQTRFVIERALDSGQVNAFEYQLRINGENKTFEARVTPVGENLVLAIVRDVTLQQWAMSERESLIDELEMKNAELERFTYTVSHDLKSPLITIKGFLGYVREDAKNANFPRLEKDIQRVNDATDKMQRLLADLLELSRVGRLVNKATLFRADELVAEVVELLHGRISERNIKVHTAPDLPFIFGDRQRISEVFQNLIDNAAKFMGDQSEPFIEIGVKGEFNKKPVFYVRDNGIGIAPQFKEKIFGLFDKLNAQTEGTGIGLALVKRIIESHGGKIWVDSSLGNGATFYFTIPQSED